MLLVELYLPLSAKMQKSAKEKYEEFIWKGASRLLSRLKSLETNNFELASTKLTSQFRSTLLIKTLNTDFKFKLLHIPEKVFPSFKF